MAQTQLQQLVHNAVMAHDAGADMHHPAFRALGKHVNEAIDLDRYRTARRGLGLSSRQARERVRRITAFSLASKVRDAVVRRRARRMFGRKADAMLERGELGTWAKAPQPKTTCCVYGAEFGGPCPFHDGRRA